MRRDSIKFRRWLWISTLLTGHSSKPKRAWRGRKVTVSAKLRLFSRARSPEKRNICRNQYPTLTIETSSWLTIFGDFRVLDFASSREARFNFHIEGHLKNKGFLTKLRTSILIGR